MPSSLSTFLSASGSPTCVLFTVVLSTSGMADGNFFLLTTLSECDQSLNEIFNEFIY